MYPVPPVTKTLISRTSYEMCAGRYRQYFHLALSRPCGILMKVNSFYPVRRDLSCPAIISSGSHTSPS